MATADLDPEIRRNGETQADPEAAAPPEAGPEQAPEAGSPAEAPEPVEAGLAWDDSVTHRPIGLGWHSEPVVIDRGKSGGGLALLVLAGGGRKARLYRPVANPSPSPGSPPSFDAGVEVDGLDGLRCACPLPGSGPGRVDLVGISAEGLVLLRDEGTAEAPKFAAPEPLGLPADLGLGAVRVARLAAVDWDGDGRVDLLVGLDDLAGYWPDEGAVPPEQRVGFNQKGGHPGYDQGGRWRGRPPEGRLHWLRNVGEPGRPRFEVQPEITSDAGRLEIAPHPAPLAVSWYGGDNLELLLADSSGLARVHRNFGGQRPPVLMEPRTLKHAGAPLRLPEDLTTLQAVDLDGDGRVELVGGTDDGRVFSIRATGRDSASAPTFLNQEPGPLWLSGHSVVAAADLDGDGGLDLVFGDGPGHLYWAKDRGRGVEHRYALPTRIEAGGAPFRLNPGPDGRLGGPSAPRLGFAAPAVVDWTGNGRPDLIVGGAGGEVLLFRNDGSAVDPRFAPPIGLRCEGAPLILPPRVRPAAVDWRGTGQVDLIAPDLQGFLCVYPRVDEKNVGAPVPVVDRLGRVIRLDGGFGLGGRCSLWAGPWTGTGKVDVLVGLPESSARFVVPATTGRPLAAGEPVSTVLVLENLGRLGLVPRPLAMADGSPVVVGVEGCSPSGVTGSGDRLDLLVGSDDGLVHYLRREDLGS